MKKIVAGIIAHVDSGKTTLSEGMLYTSGNIRTMGRVDNKDAFLDTDELEKQRGITIFSKQAELQMENLHMTLLDTPGHVDFAPEMERTLQVIDYAILVVSGADGVQGHTKTLWYLLKKYQIPVFVFMNKMDQPGTDAQELMAELKRELSDGCEDFTRTDTESFYENVAVCDEEMLEKYLEDGTVEQEDICKAIAERKLFPVFFGSALKLQGVTEFLQGMERYIMEPEYPEEFGAKVFKIARDGQGNRLTYLKVTGGCLKVRTSISGGTKEQPWKEKVNQIRIYSGEKFETVNEMAAGGVCAVTGLSQTYPGEGLGREKASGVPILEPVLSYAVELPEGMDALRMLPKLRELEEEEPELHILWEEEHQEIKVQIMGEVQIEILKSLIGKRFGVEVEFGAGTIVYKETIASTVEGVGHFEPLRHYAEVHLRMEPLPAGSGMVFDTDCSEDVLDKNWQRLILTHLQEREHRGVLTGSAITDMKITLVSGRAHQKHTEGGDFRQATYRAVRQGLMQAESMLLEPYYEYRLEVPEQMIGRAMTDLEQMGAKVSLPETSIGKAVLTGTAPVSLMQGYQQMVIAYTKGHGRLFTSLKGYGPCHNTEEVVAARGYDPEADLYHPTGSVFCAHGAGFVVPWHEVETYMHLPYSFKKAPTEQEFKVRERQQKSSSEEEWIGLDEIDAILSRTYHANRKKPEETKKWASSKKIIEAPGKASMPVSYNNTTRKQEEYLLVDGYNIIFAWDELKELAEDNIDGARGKLLDILCDYQGMKKMHLIAVFDAYRVKGHQTEVLDYHNIHVVYTKEAETADQYIEKFAHENGRKYKVMVATSDGLEQVIIRGQGCQLISARELEEEIKQAKKTFLEMHQTGQHTNKNYFFDGISEELRAQIKDVEKE